MSQRSYFAGLLAAVTLAPAILFAAGANSYVQRNLVSDVAGQADVRDPNLVNPWGLYEGPATPFWVNNQGKGNATLYNGSGAITSLVVTVPPAGGSSQTGRPTGGVNNAFTAFQVPSGTRPSWIFSTEDGLITAFAGGTTAVVTVDNSASGAVYKGLAIGSNAAGAPLLYAPNFNSGKIDVFDAKYTPTSVAGGFVDASVAAGFAPFNIWALSGRLYVSYAKQDSAKKNDVAGAGNGFVAVFDFDGNLIKHLVSNGPLNSPWGLAIAPATFGAFAGNLLVGNFGDGKINAFDLTTGALQGTLQDTKGNPIINEGLWALLVGNGGNGGDRNTVYVTAGPSFGDTKVHGLLAAIAPPAAILSVLNGASQLSGPISPGEVLVMYGLTIGPSPASLASVPASGSISTAVGGNSITFNGTPASILYTSASQASVLAPYELAGSSTANISVTYRGQTATLQVPVASTAPGLFTTDFSGAGQAVALNVDGTVNSSKNPATAGTVITLFATGEGITNPPGENGVVNDRIIREPQAPVSLTIANFPARIIYAGTAPGLVQGVMQIEAVIPSIFSGPVPVVLTVGTASSQPNVSISLK